MNELEAGLNEKFPTSLEVFLNLPDSVHDMWLKSEKTAVPRKADLEHHVAIQFVEVERSDVPEKLEELLKTQKTRRRK